MWTCSICLEGTSIFVWKYPCSKFSLKGCISLGILGVILCSSSFLSKEGKLSFSFERLALQVLTGEFSKLCLFKGDLLLFANESKDSVFYWCIMGEFSFEEDLFFYISLIILVDSKFLGPFREVKVGKDRKDLRFWLSHSQLHLGIAKTLSKIRF